MLWVKHILNDDFNSFWKHIEISDIKSFHHDVTILFKSHAPEKILCQIKNTQMAVSLRSWYIFRERAAQSAGLDSFFLKELNAFFFFCNCIS